MKKIIKYIVIDLLVAAVIATGIIFAIYEKTYLDGLKAYTNGDYDIAIEEFSKIQKFKDSSDLMQDSKYLQAIGLFNDQQYMEAYNLFASMKSYKDADELSTKSLYTLANQMMKEERWSEAEGLLLMIGTYEDSDTLVSECQYEQANDLEESSNISAAMTIYQSLGDYRDASKKFTKLQKIIYDRGVEWMHRGEFQLAMDQLDQVSDYSNASSYINYCARQLSNGDAYYEWPEAVDMVRYNGGTLFEYPDYFLYIPHGAEEDGHFLVYFPGGNGEYTLFDENMKSYLMLFQPKNTMLFWKASGIDNIDQRWNDTYLVLNKAAQDHEQMFQDLAIVASSNGGYTALKATYAIGENYLVPITKTIILDMGMSFTKPFLPTQSEYAAIGRAGTELYLFEQKDMTPENEYIAEIVKSGIKTTMVYCRHEEHDRITQEAFGLGVFSWAVGESGDLNNEEYNVVPVEIDKDN